MTAWKHLLALPSPTYPELPWTPAIEVEVLHTRFDRPSLHPSVAGYLVDRHTVRDAALRPTPRLTRDYPGNDETPDGGSVSLASGPRPEGATQGGELLEKAAAGTRFQRDWDFLAMHARLAFERYRSLHLPLLSGEAYQRGELDLSDWRKAEALTLYARNWKTRSPHKSLSTHPVDVLFYSHHCSGAANLLFALATVAGLRARRISISHHSVVEILIGDTWVWCENIVSGSAIHPCSFYTWLENLSRQPDASPRQIKTYARKQPFYRAPFQMDQTLFWRMDGHRPGSWGERDIEKGQGLTLAWNPATAAGLDPHALEHRYPCLAPDRLPRLTLKEKQGWIRTHLRLQGASALRARHHLSASDDNPLRSACARVWVAPGTPPEALALEIDGVDAGRGTPTKVRVLHDGLEFALPAPAALTPGDHEIVLRARPGHHVDIVLQPELLDRPLPCGTGDIVFAPRPDDFLSDPVDEVPVI